MWGKRDNKLKINKNSFDFDTNGDSVLPNSCFVTS